MVTKLEIFRDSPGLVELGSPFPVEKRCRDNRKFIQARGISQYDNKSESFHFNASYSYTAKDLAGEYPAIQYNSPDGSLQIDILSKLGDAFSYEDLQFEEKHYEGGRVRVATPETLYRMKKDAVRLQDRADAETIKEIFNLKG
jgi:hypothetical protein